jgi:hypothetical protein
MKVEVFLSVPPCSGGKMLLKRIEKIQKKHKGINVVIYRGRTEGLKKYHLTAAPAVVVDGFVKIMGVCPSEKTMMGALKEAGL